MVSGGETGGRNSGKSGLVVGFGNFVRVSEMKIVDDRNACFIHMTSVRLQLFALSFSWLQGGLNQAKQLQRFSRGVVDDWS